MVGLLQKLSMEKYLRVGVITMPHGLNGEVKVFPTTDDPKRFKKLKEVYMTPRNSKEMILLHPETVHFFKQFVLLKFKEYSNVDEVSKFRQADLYVDRKDAVELGPEEYFIADLIGMSVVDEENGTVYGPLKDVLQTGANDVYLVDYHGQELLLPAIRDCIKEVDFEKSEIRVHMMEGLLDLMGGR